MKTRIEITYIDSTTDLILTDDRAKRIGVHSVEIMTENVYKLITEADYKQQRVQSTIYNKYQVSFVATEDYNVELLKIAQQITIKSMVNIHDAVLLDLTTEIQADTDFLVVRFEYYDRNQNNYIYALPPVTDFLRSDALMDRYELTALNYITLFDDAHIATFATLIDFKQMAEQPEEQSFTNTQAGSKVTTNSIIKSKFDLVFYLNAADIIPFQEHLPLADFTNIQCWYYNQGTPFEIKETPGISVELTNGNDLYKCSCTFVTSIINTYQYG